MRHAISFVLFLSVATALFGQTTDRTRYMRESRIRIPFELKTDGQASSVKLFVSPDGEGWKEYDSARPGQKREFIFNAERDGTYAFATMTIYRDGTSDPARRDQLSEQVRVVVDRAPPKVASLRSIVTPDGAAGIEWDIVDDYMDPKGVRLEYRWPDMGRFEPIDRMVPFGPRDQRHWQLRPDQRMQVRVVATDRAGNKTESEAVWVSTKDGERSDSRPIGNAASATRNPAPSGREDYRADPSTASTAGRTQVPLHYVNTKSVTLNSNASVGPSGLTGATLWVADDKLEWKPGGELPAMAAPPTTTDKPRVIPVNFTYEAPKDGHYFFIIVVKNHVGPNRRAPVKGDNGEVQVIVDTTMPEVQILSTKVAASGDRGAVVDIRWSAKDANLAPVPVKLEYQAVGTTEWKAITPDWIDNTGQHTWAAPTGENHKFHIRVTAKDRAGNEGLTATKEPINVDLAKPVLEYADVVPGLIPNRPGGGGISVGPGPGPGPKR